MNRVELSLRDRELALLAVALLAAILVGLLLALATEPNVTSVVVGVGCEGASAPLVAAEEDMLPICESVIPATIIKDYAR